jgi:hypothetical protein
MVVFTRSQRGHAQGPGTKTDLLALREVVIEICRDLELWEKTANQELINGRH